MRAAERSRADVAAEREAAVELAAAQLAAADERVPLSPRSASETISGMVGVPRRSCIGLAFSN